MDISFLILCASVLCTTIHINSRNVLEPYKSFYSFLPSLYIEQSRAHVGICDSCGQCSHRRLCGGAQACLG